MSENGELARFPANVSQLFNEGTVILFTCAVSDDFPLLSVTQNSKKILGYDPSYFLENETGWSDRIHPEDKPHVMHSMQKVIDSGSETIQEYRFKTKKGDYIWLRDEVKVMNNTDGKAYVFGASVDITGRKKAELEVAEAKEHYQSVVTHIKDIAFTLNGKGCFTFLNSSWEETTGFRCKDSLQKPLWDYIHPDDRAGVKKRIRALVDSSGKSETNVVKCLKKDGNFLWAELFMKQLPESTGETVITGTLVDISEEIKQRQKMEEANEQLQERVEEHSRELEEEIERRKEVEQELVQRLSYEKAITKFASILLESTSEEALKKGLKILMNATNSDRVYYYKNVREGEKLFLEPVIEIFRSDVSSQMGNPGARTNYDKVPWWRENLSRQKIIHAQIDEIPEPERKILEDQNVKSVLVLPVFIDQEWHGYIGFSDLRKKRSWKYHKIALLKTAAGIVSAFERRRMIEKSLVEQRNYTETILDSLPSIYILMNEEMEFEQWNSNCEQYTGYSQEELKGKSAYDLVVPEDHEALKKAAKKVLNGQSRGTELAIRTKSGKKVPYFWQGYYITMKGENYFLSVGVDITQQKETERELMNEQRFNEALIESLPGIFYMIDREGNYLRWNKNFEREFGYDSREIEKMKPIDFYPEKEHERIATGIKEVFEDGEKELETVIKTKEGEEVPYYLTGKLFKQHDEHYIIGVGYDISEQVEARQQLKKSEELFRNLFLEAPAAIVMVSAENKVQSINKSFSNLFGYTEEELIGKDIDEVIVPEDEYEDAPKMKANPMISFHRESQRKHKNGELIDVYVAAIPVFVDGKSVAGFGMYIDITEQKKYEEEIYASLREKHVLLQEIHHRVKNNLAVVSGLIQLQMYETEDPVIRETLQESESRIQTMALIHEKLYQSKNLSRIYCRAYIRDLVRTIRQTISSEKDITVNIDVEDIELNINKSVPLALLINEAVTNSFKHAFDRCDSGKITVSLEKQEGLFEVQIRDNGNGFPDDFSFENCETLGITLIHNFLQQLDAEWEWNLSEGTCLSFSFEADDVNGSSSSGLLKTLD